MKIAPMLLLLLFGVTVFAQSPSKSHIINSRDYYYGTGISSNENHAREEAIRELSEMISVTVASEFELIGTETNMEYDEFASSVIRTYATATLKNMEQIRTILPDGQNEIFCYLSEAAVKRLYDERADMTYQMYLNSFANIEMQNLAFALKNLYFASLLIKSIPEERVRVKDTEISLEIPRTINRIIQGLKFRLTGDRIISMCERQLNFEIKYNDNPVSLLYFRFWDGNQIAGNGQLRDWKTTIKLVGNSVDFDELKNDLYKGLAEHDLTVLKNYNTLELIEQLFTAHQGQFVDDYMRDAATFLDTAKHQKYSMLYRDLPYSPMLELLAYLQDSDFEVFIVTGGEIDFLRSISMQIYNVSPENVVGSSVKYKYDTENASVVRTGELGSANDKHVKPANIQLHIGKKPIFAAGNSDGDYEMMEYTLSGDGLSMAILVNHDDAEREYVYMHGTEKAVKDAKTKGWYIVSMKNDFEEVFERK